MSLIVDFLLLAASGVACFYCWMLSKRLKALSSGEDGLGTGIAALSQSTEVMQKTLEDAKETANESMSNLELLVAEAEARIKTLETLTTQIQQVSEHAVDETESATRSLINTLEPHIKDAREAAEELLNALEKNAAAPTSTTETSDIDIDDENAEDVTPAPAAKTKNRPKPDAKDAQDEDAADNDEVDLEFVPQGKDDESDEDDAEGEAA